jgi:hypothetical protein
MKNEENEYIYNEPYKNMYIIQFKPNVKTPHKIFEYISLYANNIKIFDVVKIIKTTDKETYWRVFIQADQACFRNLQNYLDE